MLSSSGTDDLDLAEEGRRLPPLTLSVGKTGHVVPGCPSTPQEEAAVRCGTAGGFASEEGKEEDSSHLSAGEPAGNPRWNAGSGGGRGDHPPPPTMMSKIHLPHLSDHSSSSSSSSYLPPLPCFLPPPPPVLCKEGRTQREIGKMTHPIICRCSPED